MIEIQETDYGCSVEIPEATINTHLRQHAHGKVSIYRGEAHISINSLEAKIRTHSHSGLSVVFEVVKLRPFYYRPFLSQIPQKVSFMEYQKKNGKKLFTCHLHKIENISDIIRQYAQGLQLQKIVSLEFCPGYLILELV